MRAASRVALALVVVVVVVGVAGVGVGNSGNPYDRQYGDLVDDWLDGRLIPLPFTAIAVARATVSMLTLLP